MTSRPAGIFAYVFIRFLCVAGPVFLLISAATGLETAHFVYSSLSTEGVVVDFHYIRSARRVNTWSCAPVFRFTANDGRNFTVTSNTGQNPCPWRIGDSIRILYKESHPEHARVDSFFQLWTLPIVFGFLGALSTFFPIRIFLLRRRAGATG
jgi:hypothetical protein